MYHHQLLSGPYQIFTGLMSLIIIETIPHLDIFLYFFDNCFNI